MILRHINLRRDVRPSSGCIFIVRVRMVARDILLKQTSKATSPFQPLHPPSLVKTYTCQDRR